MLTGIKDWFLGLEATTIVLLIISVVVVISIIVTIVSAIKLTNREKRNIAKTNEKKDNKVNNLSEKSLHTTSDEVVKKDSYDGLNEVADENITENHTSTDVEKEHKDVGSSAIEESEEIIEDTSSEKENSFEKLKEESKTQDDISEEIIENTKEKKAVKKEEQTLIKEKKQVEELDEGREITGIIEEIQSKDRKVGKITIYRDNQGKFRFQIVAANHEPVGHSQAYATKSGCKDGVKAVLKYRNTLVEDMTNSESQYRPKIGTASFEIFYGNNGKYRFRLRSRNYRLVLASQDYTSKAACSNGVEAVKRISENYSI